MATYKRWKGQKIGTEHEHWKDARWTVEFVINNKRIIQSVPEARTQAQAERAESKLREDVYNRRYGNGKDVGFSTFFTESYLPWVKDHKAESTYRDAVSRGHDLKKFFAEQPIREITRKDAERFKSQAKKVETKRKELRAGPTVNRYLSLLSAVCKRAIREEVMTVNPCSLIDEEEENTRARYLTPDEQEKLLSVCVGDLNYMLAPTLVSLHTGLRKKIELLSLKVGHLNFTSRPVFFPIRGGSAEIPPNWMLIVRGKGRKWRVLPMNTLVRSTLSELCQDRKPTEFVFDKNANGVNYYSLRWGFDEMCTLAEIPYGEKADNGIIWHDLRRTFATRLRACGVHAYDIGDLLGHARPGVTGIYARATQINLEQAVEKLTESVGQVLEFERRVG